ncbi:hypothetical protein K439DRAFT_1368342, partial [Ramaria rubella]
RIQSEHAIGYLKGWFASLKGLWQQIDDEVDHQQALEWIRACIVIHTLIRQVEEEQAELPIDYDFEEELVGEGMSSEYDSDSKERQGCSVEL